MQIFSTSQYTMYYSNSRATSTTATSTTRRPATIRQFRNAHALKPSARQVCCAMKIVIPCEMRAREQRQRQPPACAQSILSAICVLQSAVHNVQQREHNFKSITTLLCDVAAAAAPVRCTAKRGTAIVSAWAFHARARIQSTQETVEEKLNS